MAELTNPPYNRLKHFLEIFRRASLANKGSSTDSLLKNLPKILKVPKLIQISNDKISARYSKLLPRYPEESLTEIHYEEIKSFFEVFRTSATDFQTWERTYGQGFQNSILPVSSKPFAVFFWSTLGLSASFRTLGKNFRTLLKNFSCTVTF